MQPKVSVITVNLNNHLGLKRTLNSVIQQNYKNFEYLVIDGDSSDGSRELIKEYADKINFWLSEKDTGVYSAMNKGVLNATGDYLIFLNSGDHFSNSQALTNLISNSSGEDLVFGNIYVQESGMVWTKRYTKKLNFRYFYFESLPHPACLISRRLFDQYGLYDTFLKIASDWKFFLLVVAKYNCTYKYVDKEISTFYFDGMSSNKANVIILENERRSTMKKYFYFYYLVYNFYLKVLGKDKKYDPTN